MVPIQFDHLDAVLIGLLDRQFELFFPNCLPVMPVLPADNNNTMYDLVPARK